MIIIVDRRRLVLDGYRSSFRREGVATVEFEPAEFTDWLGTTPESALGAVEAVLLGDCCPEEETLPGRIREKMLAPIIAMSDSSALEDVLRLFSAGVDDVVRKPVHVREILARVNAIMARLRRRENVMEAGPIRLYADGRAPEVNGEPLQLPRREYRILHYLVTHKDRRVTKAQLFDYVYGMFEDGVEECVIESHISKLRKKLRARLGYDPIDSRRYLGYCLHSDRPATDAGKAPAKSAKRAAGDDGRELRAA
jgi:DNA-binding response OmpR family regulator